MGSGANTRVLGVDSPHFWSEGNMTQAHTSHWSMRRRVLLAAATAGFSTSAFGQILKTVNFTTDPLWVGVDNMTGNQDGLHPPGTQTVSPHGTNFGWAPNLDTTGTSVLPPDFDGPGPFVPTASGPGEAGGGFANGSRVYPPAGTQSYYADRVGPFTMNDHLIFTGLLTFTENRDRMFIGFLNSFEHDTTYGPEGTQPGPAQGGYQRPELMGLHLDASSGIRTYARIGRAKTFTAGGFNMSTERELIERQGFFTARNGVGPTITPVPFIFEYNPSGGPSGFGSIKVTVPGATFNPFVGDHQAIIRDETGPEPGVPDGIDDVDLDGNDAPEDAEVFEFALSQAQRNIANTFVFDRFGMVNGLRDQAAGDNGQDAFIDDMTYSFAPVPVINSNWNVDANGNWSLAGNWSAGVPNAAGATANFGNIITAPRTVTLDAPQTVGNVTFDNANSYTISGTQTLTLDASSGSATLKVLAGSHTIAAPIVLADATTVDVAAGQTLSVQHLRGAGLTVNTGNLKILAGGTANSAGGTSKVTSLSIAAAGKLDLTNNSLVIDYTGAVGTLVGDVRQHLQSGRLISSSATTTTGLGYADNAVLNPVKTTFAGQNVDPSSLLVKFTYFGDSDLDGDVDVADLGNLATNWQTANVWSGGDFDYNGSVDVNDLGLLATNWQAGTSNPLGPASLTEALASLGLPSAAVPEPSTVALLSLLPWSLRRGRRRARHDRSRPADN
jgi:hypothetical protein